MNNNSSKNKQRKVPLLLTTVLVLWLSTSLFSRPFTPTPVTDEGLFDRAFAAYWKKAWLDAAVNLYAYMQRDPQAMSNKTHSDQVQGAYNHCVTQLRNAVSERNQFALQLNRQDGGERGIQSSLESPPALDKPVQNTTNQQVKNMQCDVYARIALTQSELNTKHNCGYDGNRWSSNYDLHFNWCMESADSSADVESAERQKLLTQCAIRKAVKSSILKQRP
jgi:hypothetical protein